MKINIQWNMSQNKNCCTVLQQKSNIDLRLNDLHILYLKFMWQNADLVDMLFNKTTVYESHHSDIWKKEKKKN